MTQTTPRVLIVEDDPVTASEIGAILAAGGLDCDRRASLAEAMARAADQPFDVIVLDRMLPDGDGIAAMQGLRAARPGAMILVVSALGTASSRIEGLDLGADDYLAKPFHTEELLARLRALTRRAQGLASPLLQCGELTLDTRSGRVTVAGQVVALTSHEYRLLAYLMHRPGRVVSRSELTEHLYAQDFDRDSNTIEVFVARLRRKLPPQTIETVRGLGYRLTAD